MIERGDGLIYWTAPLIIQTAGGSERVLCFHFLCLSVCLTVMFLLPLKRSCLMIERGDGLIYWTAPLIIHTAGGNERVLCFNFLT